MMRLAGEFRRLADEQAASDALASRRVQNALRDAAARIDELEKRLLELDAACCEYERQRDAWSEKFASVTDERRHAVAALSEENSTLRRQRDIARREFCRAMADKDEDYAQQIAEGMGWDCFPEVKQ